MAKPTQPTATAPAAENPLAAITQVAGASNLMNQSVVDDMLKSTFLPRLQVCGSSSEVVKQGLVQMGNWALVYDKERVKDLGKEIDILAVAFRPQALRLPKDGNPTAYYNREHPEFKRIQADSKIKDSGCMFGLQFLVWVPSARQFALLYLGTWSGRKQAPSLLTEMKKNPDGSEREQYGPNTVTCRQFLDKNKAGQSYHVPRFYPCTSTLSAYPEQDALKTEVETFNNPPESQVEPVQASDQGGENAARAR